MIQKVERLRLKEATKRLAKKTNKTGAVVISCKRAEFNHHKGEMYSNFSPDMLASGGWKHYKSKGDHFTIHAMRDVSYLTNFKPNC